jgi:hypothetical protein
MSRIPKWVVQCLLHETGAILNPYERAFTFTWPHLLIGVLYKDPTVWLTPVSHSLLGGSLCTLHRAHTPQSPLN